MKSLQMVGRSSTPARITRSQRFTTADTANLVKTSKSCTHPIDVTSVPLLDTLIERICPALNTGRLLRSLSATAWTGCGQLVARTTLILIIKQCIRIYLQTVFNNCNAIYRNKKKTFVVSVGMTLKRSVRATYAAAIIHLRLFCSFIMQY